MNQDLLLAQLRPMAEKIDAVMHEDLRVVEDALLRDVLQHALFNGGKRIRPLLGVLASQLCGMTGEAIYNLAIAFEYLHVATLLHDDVIDHAEKRRGRQTANTIYGGTPTILAGDFLHARSMFLIGSRGGSRCLEIICKATAAMVEGEFLQLSFAGSHDLIEDDYFKVVNGKTAVLIAAVCEIGGIAAGGTMEQQRILRNYGTALGQAFQVVDDLLDYLGDPRQTGKAVGNDFVEGKMTLPLIYARDKADEEGREFLVALLADSPAARVESLDAVRRLIENYGGFRYAREKAETLIHTALEGLDIFTATAAPAGARVLLTGLAGYVLSRKK
jgi:octaprenyl-diphosphate synthase